MKGFLALQDKETYSAQAAIKTLRVYLREIRHGWRYTLSIFAVMTVGSVLVFYAPPLVIAYMINAQQPITFANGWPLLIIFGLVWLGGEICWRIAMHFMARFEAKTVRRLYDFAFAELVTRDMNFFNDRFTGTITKNVIGYARRFEQFFDIISYEIISQVGPAIFALVVLAIISPILAVGLVAMMAAGVLIAKPIIARRATFVKDRERLSSALSGHVADAVGNVAAIKSFAAEKREILTHRTNVNKYITASLRSWDYNNLHLYSRISPIYVATNVLGLGIILSLGVDTATKAALFLAFSYYATVSRFLWSFNSIYRNLEESITEASLFTDYLEKEPEILDSSDATNLSATDGTIVFHDVQFAHKSSKLRALFDEFSLTIPSGQRVGLVGHSGAGKSTITHLLLRFIDVDKGFISIDGQNIAHVTQASLHESISYVPQEPILFHRSLRENIAYGKPDASDEEVRQAAKAARALEFIEELPNGFATLVGERGVKLSGGQRQRIAIARAILKDAPILVLDEATSALDSESEKLIQESLSDLMKERTSIVIAHRLSTIAKLDRIVVLDKGKIVEAGTHNELLEQKGTYASLWKHQSGGFISD